MQIPTEMTTMKKAANNRITIGKGPSARSYTTYTNRNRAAAAARRIWGPERGFKLHETGNGRWYFEVTPLETPALSCHPDENQPSAAEQCLKDLDDPVAESRRWRDSQERLRNDH
ncbi:MAG: hypothetical protein HQL84_18120 [Magnetococcales bacterium]|nr:hypothetical protein [Magnetococcales bacterium]MBF0151937.1 hypothetical protein [Magnetococcales bacterium]MBF0631095.1 hypothetical protein [Magnetococcales bacterium]